MSIDLKIELAKQEYVDAINEINSKYDLPITISEIILDGIIKEVHEMKIAKIMEERNDMKIKELESDNNG